MANERIERADWESVRKRTDWNLQVIKWLVHQSRPCLRAKVSAVKLEAIGPVEKDRKLDVLHLEHVTYTPALPGPKREGTDSCTSVLPPHRGGAVPSPMGMGRNGGTDLPSGSTKRSPPLFRFRYFVGLDANTHTKFSIITIKTSMTSKNLLRGFLQTSAAILMVTWSSGFWSKASSTVHENCVWSSILLVCLCGGIQRNSRISSLLTKSFRQTSSCL